MDDLAHEANIDPLTFRLQNLRKEPRAQEVLRAATRMADWKRKRPAGHALGLAYSNAFGSHLAQVVEMSLNKKSGRIRVHEVWCAADVGFALQPRNVAAQTESGVMYGLSIAFGEQVPVVKGEPQPSNFHDYPVLRMDEAPKVHVEAIHSTEPPGGAGEIGVPPVAPAISDALLRLTGKRLRDLPLDHSAVVKA